MSKPHQIERVFKLVDLGPFTGNVKRETIYKWMRLGQFPRPIRTAGNRVAWLESDLARWQAARIAEAAAKSAPATKRKTKQAA